MSEETIPAEDLRAAIDAAHRDEPAPQTSPTGAAPPVTAAAQSAAPVLRVGSSGPGVEAWQTRLCALGYDPGKIDGVFGPKTMSATQAFQSARGFTSTGMMDGATWIEAHVAAHKDMPLGRALLVRAQRDVGVNEVRDNFGPRIAQYQATVEVASGSSYCAAAVSTWLQEACKATCTPMPIAISAAAKGLEAHLAAASRWMHKSHAMRDKIAPGWIVVWDRSHTEPWKGHVGVVETVSTDGLTFSTIEANITTPDTAPTGGVARRTHTLDEPLLRGGGWVDQVVDP